MDTIELLQRLLTSLEAQEAEAGKVAWKALQKAAGDVVKPWAPMLTFKHSWCPPPNGVLQKGLTEGGALRALVEATVARYPRELWEPVQEVPLKGVWSVKDRRWGDAPRMLARAYKKSFCIYDPRDLTLVETLKPASLTEVVFADDGGLRATDGTKVLTRGPGETKWKKVHDFNEASATALSAKVAAALQTVVTGEGDDAVAHMELYVFVFETGTATTFRLEGTDFWDPMVAGGTALVATNEGRLLISELGAALVERSLPPDNLAYEFVEMGGTRWLRSGPWRRLDDLSEVAWGHDFEDPHGVEGAVWADNGERFLDGRREAPVSFEMSCRGVMALSNRELVGIRVDGKDKPFFVRFKRFS